MSCDGIEVKENWTELSLCYLRLTKQIQRKNRYRFNLFMLLKNEKNKMFSALIFALYFNPFQLAMQRTMFIHLRFIEQMTRFFQQESLGLVFWIFCMLSDDDKSALRSVGGRRMVNFKGFLLFIATLFCGKIFARKEFFRQP